MNPSRQPLCLVPAALTRLGFGCLLVVYLSGYSVFAALQPYAVDAATLHLWHLDETVTPCVDAAPGAPETKAGSGVFVVIAALAVSHCDADATTSSALGGTGCAAGSA